MCFQVFKDIRGLLLGAGAEVATDQLGVLEEEGLALGEAYHLRPPKASTTVPSASASRSKGSLYLSFKAFWAG